MRLFIAASGQADQVFTCINIDYYYYFIVKMTNWALQLSSIGGKIKIINGLLRWWQEDE